MRGNWGYGLAAFAALALAGCSDVPVAEEPHVSAGKGPKLGQLVVAPIPASAVKLDAGEASRGWQAEEVFTREVALEADMVKGLEKAGAFDKIRVAAADPLDSWNKHDDWVLATTIKDVRISSDRHWYYYPNLLNCLLWVWTSWWVAGEDYTLSFDAHVTVMSGESGQVILPERIVKVSATGSLDEFDRGFHLLGCLYPFDDKDQWVKIASTLLPKARQTLAENVAADVTRELRLALDKNQTPHKKTLVLAAGLSRYAATRYPTVNFADKDAADVANAFGRFGAQPHHVVTLTNGGSTLAAVKEAVSTHLSRAREGDAVVFYFAGLGTRTANGEAALLFYDSDGTAGQLTVRELAALLAPVKGNKLVVVDASFDGASRSVKGGPTPASGTDFGPLTTAAGTGVIAAASPGDAALAPDYVKHGLFTYHVLKAIEKQDDSISADGLVAAVRDRVAYEAARSGEGETPSFGGAKFEVKATAARK